MRPRLRLINRRKIYRGRIVEVCVDRVVEPNGVAAEREVVVHRGSVVLLPQLDDGRVLLVRQYRYAVRQWLWELVAGGIERGESPAQAARRELLEEAGYRSRVLKKVFDYFPSPGVLTERMVLFEARGLTLAKASPEPDEFLELGRFTPLELRRMLRERKIRDGKTLIGLLWLFAGTPLNVGHISRLES